jgi:hypothetical protein
MMPSVLPQDVEFGALCPLVVAVTLKAHKGRQRFRCHRRSQSLLHCLSSSMSMALCPLLARCLKLKTGVSGLYA